MVTRKKAAAAVESAPEPAVSAGDERGQDQVVGYHGHRVDPTPLENYTVDGRVANLPTPETDAALRAEVQRRLNDRDNDWESPVPTITALTPAKAKISDGDFEGHVKGTGFTDASVIVWNGGDEPTRHVSDTDVWTTVKPSVVSSPTTVQVAVRTGTKVSNSLPFTWEAAGEGEGEGE